MITVYIIYDYFFPAYKAGGPIQSLLNLADQLGKVLDIKIVCSNKDHDEMELSVTKEEWTNMDGKKVFYTAKGFKGIKEAIRKRADVIFINGIYSYHFSFLPALLLKGRKIISVRGMLHPGGLSQKSFKKQVYLFIWKLLRLHRNCEYHATTLEEKAHILKAFGKETRVWIAPNLPHILAYQKLPAKKKGQLVLCTVALISPMKNHLLVLESLVQCSDEIVYHIFGPVKDEIYWDKCKAVIEQLPENVRVNYHGDIPPVMIPEVLGKSQVFIQPSKSENFGHSIYEAFTTGLPVITSHFTPWNHLEQHKAGYNVSLNDASELINAIHFFADMENAEFDQWSESARKYALQAIDIDAIKRDYLEMFNNGGIISSTDFESAQKTISYI